MLKHLKTEKILYCPTETGLMIPWNFSTIYIRSSGSFDPTVQKGEGGRQEDSIIRHREAKQSDWYLLRKPAVKQHHHAVDDTNCALPLPHCKNGGCHLPNPLLGTFHWFRVG